MTRTFKDSEQILSKYKWYKERVRIIELSIRHPTQADDLAGDRKTNYRSSNSMLETLIRVEENKDLREYSTYIMAINETYERLPDYLQKCMQVFYIERKGPYRGHARACSANLNVDRSTLYRWREKIVEVFEENMARCTTSHHIADKIAVK